MTRLPDNWRDLLELESAELEREIFEDRRRERAERKKIRRKAKKRMK